MSKLPYIAPDKNGVPVLFVHEEPFLMIGGELHNSAYSNLDWMEKEVWPYLRQYKMNTIISPIAWENIEPEEDVFDFSLLQGLIDQCRRENMKMVLLWFGLWKNGESFYVPSWVKEDYKRFFRSRYETGHPSNTVSPVCEAAVEADKKAFIRLMEFLKAYDQEEQTVIMVQVENEIGFLKAERDYSAAAEALYMSPIPEQVRAFAGQPADAELNWEEAFGEDAPEMFMAYQYGCAVETIASAGKAVYPLPMYVNAWLKQHPDRPGVYPSGGPVYSMIPMWQLAAPSIDLIAPDIYLPNIKEVCEQYMVCDNPLFIPEARRDPVTASNVFYVLGGLNGMGFSPFAIEDFLREDLVAPDHSLLEALNIDMSGFNCIGTGPYLVRSYDVIHGLYPMILDRRGTDRMKAFIRSNPLEKGTIIPMDGYDIQLDYVRSDKTGSAGLIFVEENGFYISGCNVKFTPLPKKGSRQFLTLVRLEEGEFVDGEWKAGRILNGDETSMTSLGEMAETKYVRVCLHEA